VGSIPRTVTFRSQGVFETRDNDAMDAIVGAISGSRSGVIPALESFRPRLIVFVVAAIALCFALYRFAMPALVEVAVAVTPPVVPELMSRGVMLSLDQAVFAPSKLSGEKRSALTTAFERLAALSARGSSAGSEAFKLEFRAGGAIGPNAFALPDGTIVLTDELVEMANDDEMILGVLAHEIGHVEHEHSLRQLYRAAGATALIMLIGGDIGAGTEDLLIQGTALLTLSHSREAESQADRYSVELMHQAGHDAAAIARFFELLRDRLGDVGENDFLSTHPATPERIEDTRRYADEISAVRQ
jgi:Zn-dependent protease with chaperone function